MKLSLFLLFAYLLLPVATIIIYRIELLTFFPSFLANNIALESFPGVYLFFLFMTQLLLGSRPKFLERGVGLNTIMRVHGITFLGTLAFMTVHRQLHVGAGSLTAFLGYVVAIITLFLVFVSLFLWLNTPFSRMPLIRSLRKVVHKKMQYQHFKLLHNLIVVAAIIGMIHIQLSAFASDSRIAITMVWAYFLFVMAQYLKHTLFRPYAARKQVWEVKKIVQETVKETVNIPCAAQQETTNIAQSNIEKTRTEHTFSTDSPNIVTVYLAKVSGKPFSYKAGQFGFFTFISGALKKRGEEHPFTFSSSPHEDLLSITVQDEGDYTSLFFDNCKVGDKAIIDGPYGVFCVDEDSITIKRGKQSQPRDIVAVAGGIGVTPFIGWFEHIKRNIESSIGTSNPLKITLLWMRKEQGDFLTKRVLAYNAIDNIDILLFSTTKNKELNKEVLHSHSTKNTDYYICASPQKIDQFKKLLQNEGVHKTHIHSEKFSMF